jgi:hypothetical protein
MPTYLKQKMEMKTERFLIAQGNPTAIVEGCNEGARLQIARSLLNTGMPSTEQVGFLKRDAFMPKFVMMGNETSINGTLACAYLLGGEGELTSSGIKTPVLYRNEYGKTSVEMDLPYDDSNKDPRGNKIVLFDGIGYVCKESNGAPSLSELYSLCAQYNKPAFGIAMLSDRNRIDPWVYVADTNTLFQETACGSGSVALSIAFSLREIIQPRSQRSNNIENGVITVKKIGSDRFKVSAKVDRIK